MIDWLKRERPVPYWALCCFFILVVHGIFDIIDYLS